MLSSALPVRFPIRFAENAGAGYITNPIPVPSQTPTPTSAPASFTDGFPVATFTDPGAGGIPPQGPDFNGILFQITDWARWQASGGASFYDSTFATDIGGYPKYATIASTTVGILWQSAVENNLTDPDGGSPVGWVSVSATAATVPEVQAGIVTGKYIDPYTLATSMGAASAESCYFPNGRIQKTGVIYSTYTVPNPYSIAFGTPFPNACISAFLQEVHFAGRSDRSALFQVSSVDAGNIYFHCNGTETGSPEPVNGVMWQAWGW